MKPGKLASLILLILLAALGTAAAAAAWHVPALAQLAPGLRLAAAGGMMALAFAALLLPVGIAIDRAVAEMRRCIEGAADLDDGGLYCRRRWLRPLTVAMTEAVDRLRGREQALRNQLRDMEIRHRVSEAERRQIEAVLHSMRDGVLVTDAFGEIVMANDAAAAILAFDRRTAIHQPAEQVIGDQRLRRLIGDTRETANFSDRRHVEHEIEVRSSGPDEPERRVYDVALACVENHKHEVGGVVMILYDLTREREVSQMKSDFVSKASHELRTPLSAIRAYVEMLVDGEAGDERAREEFYRIIQSEADRLGRLIDNMLNISRIEAGIVQIERESVDVKSLIQRAMHTMEPHAREKSIGLHQRLVPVDLTVQGDGDMLYQVVLNLISNAVKYTPDGGRVTISADSDNLTRSVLVTVADTGLGIPPDSLPKLFNKFYRVENYKRVAKGTGLGLSLCKHIVETVHHGQIGVESKLGMGSRFWFSVPMSYAGARAAA